MSKPIGQAGLALIRRFEGCRLTAYRPVPTERYWTIGWGHYGADVQPGQTITQARADELLRQDCQRFADAVDDPALCPVAGRLNENQRDALISFAFNCGAGCLKSLCRGRTLEEICEAMTLYDKSGGKSLPGLQRRRRAEQSLFRTPVSNGKEAAMLEIENLTDAQLLLLAQRMQRALDARAVSPALAGEVEQAVSAGITDGTSPSRFCTRAQCAAMVVRALKKGGKNCM